MPDKLNYRPNLEYKLDDVNSIDNVQDKKIEIKYDLLKNRGSNSEDIIESNLEKIEVLKNVIDQRLRELAVSVNPRTIDDLVIAYANGHSDGDRLIEDNIITYNFYKYARDKHGLNQIIYAWDMYHASVDGMIEGELLPQILIIEEDLRATKKIIDQIVNYDKSFNSTDELREAEILELEEYVQLDNDLDRLYSSKNPSEKEIRDTQKRLNSKESSMRLKRVVTDAAINFATNSSITLNLIGNQLDLDVKKEKADIFTDQARKMLLKLPSSKEELKKKKLLIYQGFRVKRDSIVAKNQDIKNVTQNKAETYKNIITNIRLHLDVALPILNDLETTPIDEDSELGFNHLIDGIEDIVINKQGAIMELKNTLKASSHLTLDQVKSILKKDEARLLYKNF